MLYSAVSGSRHWLLPDIKTKVSARQFSRFCKGVGSRISDPSTACGDGMTNSVICSYHASIDQTDFRMGGYFRGLSADGCVQIQWLHKNGKYSYLRTPSPQRNMMIDFRRIASGMLKISSVSATIWDYETYVCMMEDARQFALPCTASMKSQVAPRSYYSELKMPDTSMKVLILTSGNTFILTDSLSFVNLVSFGTKAKTEM